MTIEVWSKGKNHFAEADVFLSKIAPPLIRPLPLNATPLIRPLPLNATPLIRPLSLIATPLIRPLPLNATPLIRPLPLNATPLIRPYFRCTEIVKYICTSKLSPSRETTPLISQRPHFCCRRTGLIRGGLLYNSYMYN